MYWLIPFAISAVITGVSTAIKAASANERAEELRVLAADKLRLQQEKAKFEAVEAQNVINREKRRATSLSRAVRSSQGQTVERGRGSSGDLIETAIASSGKGASELLSKRLASTLALQQKDFDIATLDTSPGLAEQLFTGTLGAGAAVAGSVGTGMLKKDIQYSNYPFGKD